MSITERQQQREILREFINRYCIFRVPPGFKLKGIPEGHSYEWQFYLRRVIFQPRFINIIANEIMHMVTEDHPDNPVQIAGMESAAPPIIAAIMATTPIPLVGFAIRKTQKEYGLMNWIEGIPDPKLPVVLIDDISNSKTSLERARKVCEYSGLDVKGAYTIIDKKISTDVNGRDGRSLLPVRSIFTLDDFQLTWRSYYGPEDQSEEQAREVIGHMKDILWYEFEPSRLAPVLELIQALEENPSRFTEKTRQDFNKYGLTNNETVSHAQPVLDESE